MRQLVVVMLVLALHADAYAGEVLKEGVVLAIVAEHDGQLVFREPPDGVLPERVLKQLEPALLDRAREARGAGVAAPWHVAIDWRMVETGGDAQLQFEFRNHDTVPLSQVAPEFNPSMLRHDVEIVLRGRVDVEGNVGAIERISNTHPRGQLYENAEAAFRQWKFVPKYDNGVAVPAQATVTLTFASGN